MIIACDTETTGLDLWHGCKPFYFGGVDEKGVITSWRWRVNPYTREVSISNGDRAEIIEYLASADEIIWHNAKFDIRGLESIGIGLPSDIWQKSQDTILASHCLKSDGPHDLKNLALMHCDILDDDEDDLRDACIASRRIADKVGWIKAEPAAQWWPTQKTGEWWKADCWMPFEAYWRTDEEINDQHDTLGGLYDIPEGWRTVCETYANRDFERTLALWLVFRKMLDQDGLMGQYEISRRRLRATYRSETKGMTCRRWRTTAVKEKHSKLAAFHESECLKTVNNQIDNLESPKQLQAALYNILKLPVVKRTAKTGQPSTDKEVIEKLRDQIRPLSRGAWFLQHLGGYRKRSYAADSIESWERGGIPVFHNGEEKLNNGAPYFVTEHFNINLTGTDTTRTSTNPNGQNIAKGEGQPKEEGFNLRELFGPGPGRMWFTHDYSNIEMRIFAYLAGEESLLDAFERGESAHLIIAEKLYPKLFKSLSSPEEFKKLYPHYYQWVKNGNFSLIYGAGIAKADATYHVPGAYRLIRREFKQIDAFMKVSQREANEHGYITTLGGYRLFIPDKKAHKAVNYKVQGSAGWAKTLAMVRIDEYLDTMPDYWQIMDIHDELLHDTPFAYQEEFPWRVKEIMERSGRDLGLPLPVEMATIPISWDAEVDIPPLQRKKPLPPLRLSI